MSTDIFNKISKMIEESSPEEFAKQLFPSKKFSRTFIELVQWHKYETNLVKTLKSGKRKFEISRNFLNRIKIEHGFDPMFDHLHKDQFEMTKKLTAHKIPNDFVKRMDSGEEIPYEDLCSEYTKLYERTCKQYFKPFARIIMNKKINQCGLCMNKIKEFEPKMHLILEPFVSQIRNSIDHTDFYFDKQKQVIVFGDDKKPSLLKNELQMKKLIRSMVESSLAISAAYNSFKLPLWKAIIADTKTVMKYCEILQIDFDKLMLKYLPRGYSIFNLKLILERALTIQK